MDNVEQTPHVSLAQKIEQAKTQRPVGSPCIDVCRLNQQSGYCEGCLRNRAEIRAWKTMGDPDRLALLDELATRIRDSWRITSG
ncbi:DUF1289 domain-containing protein [Paraburkholderia sp. A2WS-5]|uniref:DUF1289 domain-containing protein n=1 Tax=unclassified Paraburkholderia TaxID=2615204 RepID=UPI003B828953